ncbi:MAG: pyrroline-5-carboxylate reductase [Spirochaetes bacterium GWF1_41_5]|nr:MAG: pyrroline-5-carboxylate reductase [Spirochaetes bacterium GWF1_41_5]
MHSQNTTGVIGVGNMGTAILQGIYSAKFCPAEKIVFCEKDTDRALQVSRQTGIKDLPIDRLIDFSDIIILAVKPAQTAEVCEILRSRGYNKILISIAAGISIEKLKKMAGDTCKIIRAMPNLPALIGRGITAAAYEKSADNNLKEIISGLFRCIGEYIEVEEKNMNAVTALSGSGPAYVFSFINALADGGVFCGLSKAAALKLAWHTVLGSAELGIAGKEHPCALVDKICSPGGTTITGLQVLDAGAWRGVLIDAVRAACMKAADLEKS